MLWTICLVPQVEELEGERGALGKGVFDQ